MNYGIYLPNYGEAASAQSIAELAVQAEQHGWDGFFIWDHVAGWNLPFVDPWVALAAAFLLATLFHRSRAAVLSLALAAATWVPLTVAFSSLFPPREAIRATAILTFVASAGQVIATSVTGSLNDLGGYLLAFNVALGVAVLALLMALPIREKSHPRRRPSPGSIGRLIIRRGVLVPSLLAAILQYAVWAISFGFVAILAESLGATSVALSLLVSANIAVMTVMTLITAGIVDRVGARRLAYATFALLSVATVLAAVAPSLALVFVAQLALGVAQGLGYSVLMGLSIRDVDDSERTTAMGLHQAVYAVGMFAGPWLSGLLADAVGLRPMFGLTAAACLVVPLILIRLLPRRRNEPSSA